MTSLHDIPLTTLDGHPVQLRDYAGKVLLIVNVASRCGFTKQYTGLEALYQKYKDRGLVILGFPSNDFGNQEPGTAEEIATFCSTEYPVTFPLFAKTPINGPEAHPLYTALTAAMPQHDADATLLREGLDNFAAANNLPPRPPLPAILWNFEKFIVDRNGNAIARFPSTTEPDDPSLTAVLEKALA